VVAAGQRPLCQGAQGSELTLCGGGADVRGPAATRAQFLLTNVEAALRPAVTVALWSSILPDFEPGNTM